MKDTFSSYHPSLSLMYFVLVIGFSMFLMHPVFLLISFISGMSYNLYLRGTQQTVKYLLYSLPMGLVVGLMNPLFNHEGVTILGYLGDNPITLESIYYGLAMMLLFMNVLWWVQCYSYVMTSDKIVYLLGRKMPTLALIFSMTLRMIPLFKEQFNAAKKAQQGLEGCVPIMSRDEGKHVGKHEGKHVGKNAGRNAMSSISKNKSKKRQLQQGMKLFSIMVTWLLENAMDTADSMKSRGYGLKGRTNFSIYVFKARDMRLLVILLSLASILAIGLIKGVMWMRYFPSVKIMPIRLGSLVFYGSYMLLCFLPLSLHIMEDLLWRCLK